MKDDRKTPNAPHRQEQPAPEAGGMPPAGPHAKPELTNPDATPGTGALPDFGGRQEPDPGTG